MTKIVACTKAKEADLHTCRPSWHIFTLILKTAFKTQGHKYKKVISSDDTNYRRIHETSCINPINIITPLLSLALAALSRQCDSFIRTLDWHWIYKKLMTFIPIRIQTNTEYKSMHMEHTERRGANHFSQHRRSSREITIILFLSKCVDLRL